jgi:hypothetical protein
MILQPPEYGTNLNLSKHMPLQLNSQVVVMFDRGDIYNPIIIGRLETFSEIVDETQSNNIEVSKDPAGNIVKKTFIQNEEQPNQKGTIETLSVMNSDIRKNVIGDNLTITQDLENNIGTITAVLNSETNATFVSAVNMTLASGANITLDKDFIMIENKNASITITKDLNITVQGNVVINATGNATIIAENADITANGNASVIANGNASVSAGGDTGITAGGNASLTASGNVNISGAAINLN